MVNPLQQSFPQVVVKHELVDYLHLLLEGNTRTGHVGECSSDGSQTVAVEHHSKQLDDEGEHHFLWRRGGGGEGGGGGIFVNKHDNYNYTYMYMYMTVLNSTKFVAYCFNCYCLLECCER